MTCLGRTVTPIQDDDKLLENCGTNSENPEEFQKLFELYAKRNS